MPDLVEDSSDDEDEGEGDGNDGGVKMMTGGLTMMLLFFLCMRVQFLMKGGKIRRSESLGTATERIEVCHLFGSSRPIWLMQQMRRRSKVLSMNAIETST